MGVTTLLFDKQAAITGLKTWAEFVVDGYYTASQVRRGLRNAPANTQGQVTITPLTTDPIDEGWIDEVTTAAQANLVQVEVTAAAVGDYTVDVLGTPCTYTAGALDTVTTIRDGIRAAVDLLAGPYTTAVVDDATFSILGDVDGQWLGVRVTAGAAVATVIDDVARVTHSMSARWTLRITVDAVRPANGISAVQTAAALIQRYLAAPEAPVVNGSASVYTGDYLNDAGLAVLDIGTPLVADYTTGGAGAVFTHERAAIDVVFNVRTGLAFDLPTIETFGPLSVTVPAP